jgi:RNA polymerase sigma-70 factor (ECF subfamily)
MTPAARRVVHGAEKVARLLLGLTNRYGGDLLAGWSPVLVNGEQGYRSGGGRSGAPESVSVFSVQDGRIAAIYTVLNPAKLAAALDRPRR